MSSQTSNAVNPIGQPSPPLSAFDSRLLEIEIVLPTQTFTFNQNYNIFVSGQKYLGAINGTCQCKIFNLTREIRQQIITLSSPLIQPRQPIFLKVSAGRVSVGLSLLYIGQVLLADVLQPPDIGIVFRAIANSAQTGAIQNVQYAANAKISEIAKGTAKIGGWQLKNECTDKTISNFSYTGTPNDGVSELNNMGGIQACVDNGTLIVIDSDKALSGSPYLLNSATGMVGIPQVTDQGVTVKMMANNQINLGGSVTIKSEINPAANGTYKIIQVMYEVSSRDQAFWYTLVCSNLGVYSGAGG
jgi:hypothetical protein